MTMQSEQPVGIFDSGVGGLSVLDVLCQQHPCESFVYFGDTKHVPYGDRTLEEVRMLTLSALKMLRETRGIKAAVIACNTASASLSAEIRSGEIESLVGIPVVDTILPTAQAFVEQSFRKVAILATRATVRSGCYAAAIESVSPDSELKQLPDPGLAIMIEQGLTETPDFAARLEAYLMGLNEWGVDAAVLGCTHYPHIKKQIGAHLGPNTTLVDPAYYIEATFRKLLEARQLKHPEKNRGTSTFLVSKTPQDFEVVAKQLPLSCVTVSGVEEVFVTPTSGYCG